MAPLHGAERIAFHKALRSLQGKQRTLVPAVIHLRKPNPIGVHLTYCGKPTGKGHLMVFEFRFSDCAKCREKRRAVVAAPATEGA